MRQRAGVEGRVSRVMGRVLGFRGAFILIGLTLLLGFIVWRLYPSGDDGALAEIQRRGTLRVGLDASFPPFEMINETGQIVGLDVDLAQVIAADLGVEAEFVNIGFDGLYDALLARRVDIIISGLPYDPRWTQDVAYTHNYFNAGQVLVTCANNNAVNTVEDLKGRTIAIEWGSQADMEARQLAREVEGITLLRQESAAAALTALFGGQADAAIVDAVSGVSAFSRGLKIVAYLTDEWYAAAVPIKSQALLEAVNETLIRLDESGRMAEMQAQWLHGQ
ncbi:MAG: transporter substrate-binding domain-containing protein [Anaerolineae bacterium]|nr:transporter substrate-binding domain-containing protein [Anaerolineae bacterium]